MLQQPGAPDCSCLIDIEIGVAPYWTVPAPYPRWDLGSAPEAGLREFNESLTLGSLYGYLFHAGVPPTTPGEHLQYCTIEPNKFMMREV